jgi:hypothetical protein
MRPFLPKQFSKALNSLVCRSSPGSANQFPFDFLTKIEELSHQLNELAFDAAELDRLIGSIADDAASCLAPSMLTGGRLKSFVVTASVR